MLRRAVDAAKSAATRARTLYDAGLVDFLTVLDAQRSRNEAEQARTQSETSLRTSLVALFKALGGGWNEETDDTQGDQASSAAALEAQGDSSSTGSAIAPES